MVYENDLKVEFSKDYNLLLKQAKSLLTLCNSLQNQVSYYRKKNYTLSEKRLKELEDSLESEKKMNDILTSENERLENLLKEVSQDYDRQH